MNKNKAANKIRGCATRAQGVVADDSQSQEQGGRMRKRTTTLLAGLAVALVLGMGIAPAYSYFTDTHTTNGGMPIKVTPTTTPHEWFANKTKHFTVSNAADATAPVFIRAGVFSSKMLPVTEISGSGWSGRDKGDWNYEIGDGWYYYGSSAKDLTAVAPGAETKELLVKFTFPEVQSNEKPDGSVYGDNYNMIIVYEATPVQYDENGNPYADWDITANEASEHHEQG